MRTRLRGARREAVERKLRLWSGLLIAAFVVAHLSNHALGLVSIEAMERAREWMQEFWGDPVMLALLCGSFAIHSGWRSSRSIAAPPFACPRGRRPSSCSACSCCR